MQYNRRATLASLGSILIAGCSSDNPSGDESNDDEATIEYHISDFQSYEEVPDSVLEHPNPDGFQWAIIEFSVESGEFDASDFVGLTQIEINETTEAARAVRLSDGTIIKSGESSGQTIKSGSEGEIYYRVDSEISGSVKWNTEQFENQHQSVNFRERE